MQFDEYKLFLRIFTQRAQDLVNRLNIHGIKKVAITEDGFIFVIYEDSTIYGGISYSKKLEYITDTRVIQSNLIQKGEFTSNGDVCALNGKELISSKLYLLPSGMYKGQKIYINGYAISTVTKHARLRCIAAKGETFRGFSTNLEPQPINVEKQDLYPCNMIFIDIKEVGIDQLERYYFTMDVKSKTAKYIPFDSSNVTDLSLVGKLMRVTYKDGTVYVYGAVYVLDQREYQLYNHTTKELEDESYNFVFNKNGQIDQVEVEINHDTREFKFNAMFNLTGKFIAPPAMNLADIVVYQAPTSDAGMNYFYSNVEISNRPFLEITGITITSERAGTRTKPASRADDE